MSLSSLPLLEPDLIFGIMAAYRADPRPHKVNLGVGIYRDIQGQPFVFPSVAKAAKADQVSNFEYEVMNGNKAFLEHTGRLFLGDLFDSGEWALQQSCGGTHAMRLFGDLMQKAHTTYPMLVGLPTWANHQDLFKGAQWITCPHLNKEHQIDMSAYHDLITNNPKSTLLLQGGPTHNPIGINFDIDQWQQIAQWCREAKVAIFVDFAYLGFGEGLAADRKCLEILYKAGVDLAIGVSYSKNASLYSERTGALLIRCQDQDAKERLESQTYQLIRQSVSNLPQYGVRIMNQVFEHAQEAWLSELETVRQDIVDRRERFISLLPDRFAFLRQSRGMFGMTYLDRATIDRLREDHAIYLVTDSRVNFAGIREQDFLYLEEKLKGI